MKKANKKCQLSNLRLYSNHVSKIITVNLGPNGVQRIDFNDGIMSWVEGQVQCPGLVGGLENSLPYWFSHNWTDSQPHLRD